MSSFSKLYSKINSSPITQRFINFTLPLREQFGISHFWYYKITNEGNYTYAGTNPAWMEFCSDISMLKHFTCLRHPNLTRKGVCLMKADEGEDYAQLLQTAWDKYKVNFNVNVVEPISNGIEAFGFASSFNDVHADERIINNLPLFRGFMTALKSQHQKLFHLLEDNQINLVNEFGSHFYEKPTALSFPFKKEDFLNKLGFHDFLSLSPREKEVLKHLAHGFPAVYIAKEMHLSKRTVECHIEHIKSKLFCESKIDLIHKSKEAAALGFFNI